MTRPKLPSTIAGRQMNLLFDAKRSEGRRLQDGMRAPVGKPEGMSSAERDKVILILAQILTQAVGLNVEELEDDKL